MSKDDDMQADRQDNPLVVGGGDKDTNFFEAPTEENPDKNPSQASKSETLGQQTESDFDAPTFDDHSRPTRELTPIVDAYDGADTQKDAMDRGEAMEFRSPWANPSADGPPDSDREPQKHQETRLERITRDLKPVTRQDIENAVPKHSPEESFRRGDAMEFEAPKEMHDERDPSKSDSSSRGGELSVREYKQFLANVSQKPVVSLSHQDVFEGRMLGEHEVAGQKLAVVENDQQILVTPTTPELVAQHNKDVTVHTERGPDHKLTAQVVPNRDKGLDR